MAPHPSTCHFLLNICVTVRGVVCKHHCLLAWTHDEFRGLLCDGAKDRYLFSSIRMAGKRHLFYPAELYGAKSQGVSGCARYREDSRCAVPERAWHHTGVYCLVVDFMSSYL